MIQTPQNEQSTKEPQKDNETTDFSPNVETSTVQQHHIYATTQPSSDFLVNNRLHTDQTGRFPIFSITGSNYIIMLYLYDVNAIIAEPLVNITRQKLSRAYNKWITIFKYRDICPTTH